MAGLLSDRFEDLQYRGAILPFGRTKAGQADGYYVKGLPARTVFATPGLLADAIKSVELPGRVLRGENVSADDVTKMAMDTMGGSGLLSRAIPTGDVGGLLGLNVFHGGPNRWAPEPGFPQGRPRLDKMGTGEGFHAYGRGFYSAEAENVGRSYRDDLTKSRRLQSLDGKALPSAVNFDPKKVSEDFKIPEQDAIYLQNIIKDLDSSVIENNMDSIIAKIKSQLDLYPKSVGDPETDDIVKAMRATYEAELAVANKYKDRIKANTGTLYKLDIPDADAAKYLDYDAPLSQQPPNVQEALPDLLKTINADRIRRFGDDATLISYDDFMKMTGEDLQDHLAVSFGTDVSSHPDAWLPSARRALQEEAATEALRKAGVPGLKYFDQGSRRSVAIFVDGKQTTPNGARDIAEKESGWLVGQLVSRGAGAITFGADPKEAIIKESIYQGRTVDKDEIDAAVKKAITFMDRLREGEKTRNYVTWDQDVLDRTKILDRN